MTHNWNFKNDNFENLSTFLRHEDKKGFEFRGFFNYDILLYIRTSVYGFRKYLLKLKDEDLENDRASFMCLCRAMEIFKIIVTTLIGYFVFKKFL